MKSAPALAVSIDADGQVGFNGIDPLVQQIADFHVLFGMGERMTYSLQRRKEGAYYGVVTQPEASAVTRVLRALANDIQRQVNERRSAEIDAERASAKGKAK